jgi:three-Cys-motif partner protein
MTTLHRFGGRWTEEKLDMLRKYLPAYMTIFKGNPWAARYTTHYVDAFAGTGGRSSGSVTDQTETLALFEEEHLEDIQTFYEGSARIALASEPPFDHYLFIDKNPLFVQELRTLERDFPDRANRIAVLQGEANTLLKSWCGQQDWDRHRAVLFLDPYGLSVKWSTLEVVAGTRAIDLWILLPVGQAINRMLPRQGLPPGAWADRLTVTFGSESWKDEFYRPAAQPSLFDLDAAFEKQADFVKISDHFISRLKTIFVGVSERYRPLTNSRENPLFVLFFAASNPRAAPTAVRIADSILR